MAHYYQNDYNVLAHPRILDALNRYQNEQNQVYGLDIHSFNAAKQIKKRFDVPDSEVFFLIGGTLTNMVFISSCLRHYEGVITADTGHINVHETAAVEGSGYKLITIPNINGKINGDQVRAKIKEFTDEHMVKPRLVYISNSTEIGTIYSRDELMDLYMACKENNLYLYIDGARLGSALTCKDNDLSPEELAKYCDAFYIGGAKNGLIAGEALLINNKELVKDFRYHIKNMGAMVSKGYFVGIQFEEAFKDDLYFDIAKRTNDVADYLKAGMTRLGVKIDYSPTNQIFATFPKEEAAIYISRYGCEKWHEDITHTTIRFVVGFKTSKEDVDELLHFIESR